VTSPLGPAETPDPAATPGSEPTAPAPVTRTSTASRFSDGHAVERADDAGTSPVPALGDASGADTAPGEDVEGEPDGERDESAAPADQRKRLVIVGAAVVGVLLVVLVVLLLNRGSSSDPMTVVTITQEAAVPTPQTEPIERNTPTDLLAALPDTVLGWAVSEQTKSSSMLKAHALEGWTLTYADPDSAIVLDVGQWPDGQEAKAAYDALPGDAEVISSGEVVVGGDEVGQYVTQQVDEDTERTIWRNRTAVFVAEGPAGSTQDFYDAYPF
jgi:hypothetical protein